MRSACHLSLARWAVPLALSLAACSTEHDPMEKQLKKMQDQLTQLQSETDRMGERLDAVEVRAASSPRASDDRVAAAGPATTLSRPKLKIVRVEPGVELGTESGDADQAAEADNAPRVLIQGEGKSLETRTLPAPAAAKSAPATSTKAPKADKSPKSDASK
ncbi:MAG TPA: hypothetical protein VNN72_26035 [Polyangiaceae bacterium]|nr:hypothetical protein [Polyangiaceae bacterium]